MTGVTMTFWDHISELRSRLIKVSLAILLGTILGFVFHQTLLDVLLVPYKEAVGPDAGLATFRPTEAFSVVMRVSLFGGLFLASPVVIYHIWRFVSPAMTRRERRYVIPASLILAVLFFSGVLLGYWSLERGLGFLLGFGGDDLTPVIQADAYINFALRFVLAFGIAFEFPVFLFAAAATGAVPSQRLRDGRRWAVVIILVGAAFLTPSGDPLTLLLLSGPLYLMYEGTILAIRWLLKK
ncbi:MAG: twin-arginine translocase subunit TatC [Acidimicrobiia bacterium]